MPDRRSQRNNRGGGGGSKRNRNRNRGGGGRNRGGKDKGGGMARKLATVLDPKKSATGKDLLKLARALTRTELRPEIQANKRLLKELRGQQAADQRGFQRLGEDVGEHIGGAYQGFNVGAQGAGARSAAIGSMLNQTTAGLGQQAVQQQKTLNAGQVGGAVEALSLRGAPGGGAAQQALQSLVNQQATRLAADNQATGQANAAIGANYAGLAQGAATAGALQGAEALSDTARMIAARRAEARLASGQDIREAAGQLRDTRKLKGEQMLANLTELRETERDYMLGRAATRVDKRGQDIDAATAAAERRADAREAAADRASAERMNTQDVRASRANNRRTTQASNRGDGRANTAEDRRQRRQAEREAQQTRRDARNAAESLVGQYSGLSPEDLAARKPALVRQVQDDAGVSYSQAMRAVNRALRG